MSTDAVLDVKLSPGRIEKNFQESAQRYMASEKERKANWKAKKSKPRYGDVKVWDASASIELAYHKPNTDVIRKDAPEFKGHKWAGLEAYNPKPRNHTTGSPTSRFTHKPWPFKRKADSIQPSTVKPWGGGRK